MTGRARTRRRAVRTHPYTPSGLIPADHRGQVPCICGRARANAAHDEEALAALAEEQAAAQAEHLRRIGDDQ